jgi:retinol dehydrogenase 14
LDDDRPRRNLKEHRMTASTSGRLFELTLSVRLLTKGPRYELARRLSPREVTANALHPGLVSTSLGAEDPARSQRLLVPLLRAFMTSPARGAATSIRVASDPALQGRTGLYVTSRGPKRSSQRSYDRITAARLWQVSAALVGLPTT